MVTFIGPPGQLVRIRRPIGAVKHIRFDDQGKYSTVNPKLIKALSAKFEIAEALKCKKCEYETENKGQLMVHYREAHPKEE